MKLSSWEGWRFLRRLLEEAHRLLGVVDVVGSDRILAVGDLEQLCGSDNHVAFYLLVSMNDGSLKRTRLQRNGIWSLH